MVNHQKVPGVKNSHGAHTGGGGGVTLGSHQAHSCPQPRDLNISCGVQSSNQEHTKGVACVKNGNGKVLRERDKEAPVW